MKTTGAIESIRSCRIVRLQNIPDKPDGILHVAESGKQIPFAVRRTFFITNLANPCAVRGKHAHKTLEQVIFAVSGSFELEVNDGRKKDKILMNDPSLGVYMGPGLWHVMRDFTADCVIAVLCSDHYRESDYLRTYDDFLRFVND